MPPKCMRKTDIENLCDQEIVTLSLKLFKICQYNAILRDHVVQIDLNIESALQMLCSTSLKHG